MDPVKIGKFIAELRKEQGLTQDELGQKLYVTNKTISRWENGNYMPPIESLQEMSKIFSVDINELVAGQRVTPEDYRKTAEDNIVGALQSNPFSIKEKKKFWRRKWLIENALAMLITAFLDGFGFFLIPKILEAREPLRILFLLPVVLLVEIFAFVSAFHNYLHKHVPDLDDINATASRKTGTAYAKWMVIMNSFLSLLFFGLMAKDIESGKEDSIVFYAVLASIYLVAAIATLIISTIKSRKKKEKQD